MLTDTAKEILKKRYFLKNGNNEVVENWEQLCRRVSSALTASPEDGEAVPLLGDSELFFNMIYDLKFLPNSPCLMNAGTDVGQLSACFVLPIEDSMESIFDAVKKGALIHKSGGGTGYSFSNIRPKNSPVMSTQGVASGPISFMSVFDAATETIKQGGKRRGANMAMLRVDHPDILEFVNAKNDTSRLQNFNISVAMTDAFFYAVKNNTEYQLINPIDGKIAETLPAKQVFDLIAENAWKTGEPGCFFIDTANRTNCAPWVGQLTATNPCGEQVLYDNTSCNLGSINLDKFVDSEGNVLLAELASTVRTAVRFLNAVIDISKYPIPEIEEQTRRLRPIGLGIMGLHDFLIRQHLAYGSANGRNAAARIMQYIKSIAESESIAIAERIGKAFPAWYESNQKTPARYNVAITSIQPTGTVSMIADCSSGCEPYFSIVTRKHVLDGQNFFLVNKHFATLAKKQGWFSDALMAKIAETGHCRHTEVPLDVQAIFAGAQDISPEDHVLMQAALQNNGVDSAISKTINLPESATVEDVKKIYMLAYESGCKGLTVYRNGSRPNQVLSVGSKKEELPKNKKEALPDVMQAKRYRLQDEHGAFYVIISYNDMEEPKEVFATFSKSQQEKNIDKAIIWETVCRLLSLSLRNGIPLQDLIAQLHKASGSMFDLPAQLAKLLLRFASKTKKGLEMECPECKQTGLHYSEGCMSCTACGYSKCS